MYATPSGTRVASDRWNTSKAPNRAVLGSFDIHPLVDGPTARLAGRDCHPPWFKASSFAEPTRSRRVRPGIAWRHIAKALLLRSMKQLVGTLQQRSGTPLVGACGFHTAAELGTRHSSAPGRARGRGRGQWYGGAAQSSVLSFPRPDALQRAPDRQTGGAHRALDPQQLATRGGGARLRRIRLDAGRLSDDGSPRVRCRDRPRVLRRDRRSDHGRRVLHVSQDGPRHRFQRSSIRSR